MKNNNKEVEYKLGKTNINRKNSEINISKDIEKGIELLKTMADRGNRIAISVLKELDIRNDIIKEYKVKGINDIVLKKCEDIAEFTLKKDIQEYYIGE